MPLLSGTRLLQTHAVPSVATFDAVDWRPRAGLCSEVWFALTFPSVVSFCGRKRGAL